MAGLWNVLGSFGLLLSLIWMVAAASRLHKSIQTGQEAVGIFAHMREKIELDLEKVEDNEIALKREIERLEEGRNKAREGLESLEATLTPEALAQRTRYYILADRRSPNDQAWVTPVANNLVRNRPWHPWYIESWSQPRLYVSWAANADMARRLAESKFSAIAGFALGQTTLLPAPKPQPRAN